jgi:hypothetical protein
VLPPPQPASRIKPVTTGATSKKLPFPFRERVQLRLIPTKTKPATGSKPKANRLGPPCIPEGTLTEAATDPAFTVTVALAFPAGLKVTEFELREQVGEPA